MRFDFSPDGELLASSHSDGVRLWRTRDGKLLALFDEGVVWSVLFYPDGRSLISSGKRGLRVWSMERAASGSRVQVRLGPPRLFFSGTAFSDLAMTRDGQ